MPDIMSFYRESFSVQLPFFPLSLLLFLPLLVCKMHCGPPESSDLRVFAHALLPSPSFLWKSLSHLGLRLPLGSLLRCTQIRCPAFTPVTAFILLCVFIIPTRVSPVLLGLRLWVLANTFEPQPAGLENGHNTSLVGLV